MNFQNFKKHLKFAVLPASLMPFFLIKAEGAFKMSAEHWGGFSINFNINWIEIQYLGTCWMPRRGISLYWNIQYSPPWSKKLLSTLFDDVFVLGFFVKNVNTDFLICVIVNFKDPWYSVHWILLSAPQAIALNSFSFPVRNHSEFPLRTNIFLSKLTINMKEKVVCKCARHRSVSQCIIQCPSQQLSH